LLQTADQNSACKHDIASKVKGKAITALAKKYVHVQKLLTDHFKKSHTTININILYYLHQKNKQSSMFCFD